MLCGQGLQAADPPDRAWLEFSNALGQPALIGANADHSLALTSYRPIEAFSASDIDAKKLRLGFDLFHERRLSVDNSIGCNSCHSGMFGGTDGRKVSTGARGVSGHLNAPTTFNAAFNFRQFWDGRTVTMADQALGPIESAVEMAHDLDTVVQILQNDANYPGEFAAIYPDGITPHNMGDALAYFQTVNFTRANTPFVRHLTGEDEQLSEQAVRGWKRFDEIGCASCHNGINLGGNSYQQLGAASPYFVDQRIAGVNDNGLFNRTLRQSDQHVFKVPTLHGVADTAPYFHDGSIDTLEAAIEKMAEYQLGRILSQQDVDDIAAFLQSLSGRGGMGMMMGNMGMGRGMGMRRGDMGRGHMHQGQGQGQGHGQAMTVDANETPPAGSDEVTRLQQQPASTQPGSHADAYLSAIAAAELANDKLLTEMTRIDSGEVAHFDFLQYEHLELIRHARALHHPPAAQSKHKSAELKSQAEQLLAETNELEWVIADFLRAQTMIRIMTSLIQDPPLNNAADAIGEPAARLSSYQQAAREMMDVLQASNVHNTANQLRSTFTAAR
jgi:cytochrome c peroxidase